MARKSITKTRFTKSLGLPRIPRLATSGSSTSRSELDDLLKSGGANIAESMGAGLERGDKSAQTSTMPARWQGVAKSKNAIEVPLDKIVPNPDQPREEFEPESLERLADSLRTRGQLQPIRVRWDEAQSKYALICGERRWRAAKIAGMATMSCVVSEEPLAEGELLALQLVENCLREDLRPIEQARAFKALMDKNGWSGNQAAKTLGIAQPTVVRALALLELPEPVQDQVEQGTLAPATAYEIGKVEDPESQQEIADRVVSEHLSRSETIAAVRSAAKRTPAKPGKDRGVSRTRKVPTSRTLKAAGCRITIEHRKGVDDDLLAAALREALDQVEAQRQHAA
jgi:ParB family transcriptional regulator, chromosome partitioning protein